MFSRSPVKRVVDTLLGDHEVLSCFTEREYLRLNAQVVAISIFMCLVR